MARFLTVGAAQLGLVWHLDWYRHQVARAKAALGAERSGVRRRGVRG